MSSGEKEWIVYTDSGGGNRFGERENFCYEVVLESRLGCIKFKFKLKCSCGCKTLTI